VKSLAFGLRHARKLLQMLRPGSDEHFSPERSGVFQVLVNVEKKSTIPQKDQPNLRPPDPLELG
jgi:hypothetical protein